MSRNHLSTTKISIDHEQGRLEDEILVAIFITFDTGFNFSIGNLVRFNLTKYNYFYQQNYQQLYLELIIFILTQKLGLKK